MPVAVIATGMVTSVGLDAPSTCAAVRGGIRVIEDEVLWDREFGAHIAAGKVPLRHWWAGPGKLAELVVPAIQECIAGLDPETIGEIPLLLGLPGHDRPARWPNLEEEVFAAIARKLGAPLNSLSAAIPRGNVSGVAAVELAARMIESGEVKYCVVAGADSFIDQAMIDPYLAERRILTTTNSNGFSPAEAGSAVLLAAPSSGSEGELQILATALTHEPSTITSDEPLRGAGMTEAIRTAFGNSGVATADIDYIISDLNGEHYKFKEMNFATLRLWDGNDETGVDYWHPIESLGEIGAAIGPCALGLALVAGRKGYAPSPGVLFHFSNDDTERAAMVATFVPGPRQSG